MELLLPGSIKLLMKTKNKTFISHILVLWLGLVSLTYANEGVEKLLAKSEAPEGVIFEIATGDSGALERAIPAVQRYSDALRKKFPDLSIAVVTHGREQFALTKKNQGENASVHKKVKSLVKDKKIQVHVCETYAGWEGLSAEDFPDYVDVAAAGPVQVNDYKALGYVLIHVGGDE